MTRIVPERLEDFLEDVKDSWYFRVWLILFFLGGVFTFVMMILAGERATNGDAWEFNINTVHSLRYPDIMFMLDYEDEAQRESNITAVACEAVMLSPCEYQPLSQCVYVNADALSATPKVNGLQCVVTVAAPEGTNMVLGVAIPETDFNTDASLGTSTWIQPNQQIGINLIKTIKEPKGQDEEVIWSRTVEYESTQVVTGTYVVIFRIASFEVFHYTENNEYDTWQSLGDIGGMAFFAVLLHVMTMGLISIFLPNDSKFLANKH